MSDKPVVFVSSTCYELRHLREELSRFIGTELGYEPRMSENPTFPVDLDAGTIENCQRQARGADLFVLVIGSQFGSEAPDGRRSVVNLEYETAREAGVPIFAFIEDRTLHLYEASKRDPQADLSGMVDDMRLFDFIEQVRDHDKRWMFQFSAPSDIVSTLRRQMAYRAKEAFALLRQGGRVDETTAARANREHLLESEGVLEGLVMEASPDAPGHTIMDFETRAGRCLEDAMSHGFLEKPRHASLRQVARISLERGFVYQLQQSAKERRGESTTITPAPAWHAFANVGSELSKKYGWSYSDVASHEFFRQACEGIITLLREYTEVRRETE